jgi:hypothetical protein
MLSSLAWTAFLQGRFLGQPSDNAIVGEVLVIFKLEMAVRGCGDPRRRKLLEARRACGANVAGDWPPVSA